AHLYGGIPLHQIEQLTVLHDMAKDVLYNAFQEVRPGYVELTTSVEELTENVLANQMVQNQTEDLKNVLHTYMNTYWDKLKTDQDVNNIEPLKDDMLMEVKQLLKPFKNVSPYSVCQLIEELR